MSNAFSKTLNKVVDCDEYLQVINPQTGYEKKFLIINHSNLVQLFNTLENTKINQKCLVANFEHAVYECLIEYNGKVFYQIGEVVKKTQFNDIVRDYPVTIAYQRAFDRAVISLLDFESKVFSNNEINLSGLQTISKAKTENKVESNLENQLTNSNISRVQVTESPIQEENLFSGQSITPEAPEDKKTEENDIPEDIASDTGEQSQENIDDSLKNYIITTGRKYNGKTLEEIDKFETACGGTWFGWFVEKYNAKTESEKQDQEAVASYLNIKAKAA